MSIVYYQKIIHQISNNYNCLSLLCGCLCLIVMIDIVLQDFLLKNEFQSKIF